MINKIVGTNILTDIHRTLSGVMYSKDLEKSLSNLREVIGKGLFYNYPLKVQKLLTGLTDEEYLANISRAGMSSISPTMYDLRINLSGPQYDNAGDVFNLLPSNIWNNRYYSQTIKPGISFRVDIKGCRFPIHKHGLRLDDIHPSYRARVKHIYIRCLELTWLSQFGYPTGPLEEDYIEIPVPGVPIDVLENKYPDWYETLIRLPNIDKKLQYAAYGPPSERNSDIAKFLKEITGIEDLPI